MTPSRRAASMTRVPFSTAIGLPSIRTWTMSATTCPYRVTLSNAKGLRRSRWRDSSLRMTISMSLMSNCNQFPRRLRPEGTGLLADVRLVLVPEVLERAGDRRDLGVPKGADRAAGDVAAQSQQGREVVHLAFPMVATWQYLQQPQTSLPAGGALAAGLVVEEVQEIFRGPDHARAFLHHRDPAGPQHGPGLCDRVEVHLDIQMLRDHEGGRRAPRNESLQRFVTPHPPGDVVDHLPEGDAHRHFVIARAFHVPAQAEDAGPRALGRAPDGGEPLRPTVDDMRDVRQRLDVVHHRRQLEQPVRGGERRLDARQAPVPFKGLQQGGLLPADVRARAAGHVDVPGESRTQDVRAPVAGPGGFCERGF